MLNLYEYDEIAMKIISNWHSRKGKLYADDELIGRVIRFMANADKKYDDKKSKLTRYQYRQMHAIYAIREYVKEKKLRRRLEKVDDYTFWNDPAEYNYKIGRKLSFIVKNSGLDNDEKLVINYSLAGFDISQTAERMGINFKKCFNIYKSSISKMRRIVNHVE